MKKKTYLPPDIYDLIVSYLRERHPVVDEFWVHLKEPPPDTIRINGKTYYRGKEDGKQSG